MHFMGSEFWATLGAEGKCANEMNDPLLGVDQPACKPSI
jgi:hypothetical protein